MKNLDIQNTPLVIRDYLTYIQTVKGRSLATVTEYKRDLYSFFKYLKIYWNLIPDNTPLNEIELLDVDLPMINRITLSDVYSYLVYCNNERQNNARTRARKISAIRSFFNYLHNKVNLITFNPVAELDTPKAKKSLPKYLTLEQSRQLLDAVDGKFRERDYCIITLFLNCGLRLAELCSLNITDVRNDNTMRVVGKGNKERIVYLNDACLNSISDYLKIRPVDGVKDKKALFISRQMNRISNKTVQYIVYETLKKIGLYAQGYSVHKLRHTAATLMYQHGQVDIRVLKDLLGHENLGTTEIYTHLSNQQLEQAAKLNPLADVKKARTERPSPKK